MVDFQSHGLSSQGSHEDLYSSPKSEDKMDSRLLLNVVICDSFSFLELLSTKDESLLIGRDAFFVMNFAFDGLN